MHIKIIKSSFLSFLLLAQFIVDTTVPIWVGLSTCMLKGCAKNGGTKEHMYTTTWRHAKGCTCTKGSLHYISLFYEFSLFYYFSYMLCYHGSKKTWLCINVSVCSTCDVLFRRHVLHANRYFVSLPYLDIHSNSSSTFMVVGILLNLC